MDSIQQAIDEVVNASTAQYDRFETEAYIRRVAAAIEESVNLDLWTKAATVQHDLWAKQRKEHIAMAVAHAVEMMLRQELLPDEPAK